MRPEFSTTVTASSNEIDAYTAVSEIGLSGPAMPLGMRAADPAPWSRTMAAPRPSPVSGGFAGQKIVCILAHPDDETIGCGATIAHAVAAGADVRVLLPLRRLDMPCRDDWQTMLAQFQRAVSVLGAHPVVAETPRPEAEIWHSPQDLLPLISPWIEWSDLVITHWHGDMHQSHRAVSQAVELATRPFRLRRSVIQCEIPTSSDQSFTQGFAPNLYVSVDAAAAADKVAAMSVYVNEFCPGRNPASMDRWLRIRGEQIGSGFAEAFAVARWFL